MNKYEKKYQDYCQKNKIELRNFITEMRSTSSAIILYTRNRVLD